jgi:hypothetical protein
VRVVAWLRLFVATSVFALGAPVYALALAVGNAVYPAEIGALDNPHRDGAVNAAKPTAYCPRLSVSMSYHPDARMNTIGFRIART